MKTLTLTCETVTPLFLAGADGKTPELRAPSIKGALRFWWRAINGEHKNYTELKEQEAKIFGDTSRRSSFALRVRLISQNGEQVKLFDKTNDYVKNYPGIHYLLYSTFLKNNAKSGYPEGSAFELIFSFSTDEHYTEILKALVALLHFGALGTRSRRGAGIFQIKKLKINEPSLNHNAFNIFKNVLFKVTTAEQLKKHYETVQTFLAPTANNEYSTLNNSQVYLFEPQKDWKEALNFIGQPFNNFRGQNQGRISDTPNFGFPIMHRNAGTTTTMQGGSVISGKVDEVSRRASPLLFRVVHTTNNLFFPVLIWLNGDLLPTGYDIMDKKGDHSKPPDPQIIQDFINTLSPTCRVIL